MILVTGAGGKTGRAVLRALRQVGAATRALVHRPENRAAAIDAGAAEVVVGDLTSPADLEAALRATSAVYLVCPNLAPDEFEMADQVVQAAGRCGLMRLVYHSVLHPQTEAMPHHWQKLRAEERLLESGLEVTILQPGPYMQNLRGYWQAITSQGVYRVPYPVTTRLSLVDLDDVGQAAAMVLTQPGHVGATYELCGPEAMTQDQVASALAQVLSRRVQAEAMPLETWLSGQAARELGDYQRQTLAAMFRYYAAYGLVGNPNVLTWLLGRRPATLAEVLSRGWAAEAG